jgi:3D (Asp-Asp-Asp) domain-containing protein
MGAFWIDWIIKKDIRWKMWFHAAGIVIGCVAISLPQTRQKLLLEPCLTLECLGELIPTAYRSIPSQTKPVGGEWTASGEHCHVRGCAISQDFLKDKKIQYGDLIYIDGIGFKFVTDCMNKRHKRRCDIWVETALEEHKFELKYKQKPLKVWLIKIKEEIVITR